MVISWFNLETGKIDENKIDTSIFDEVHDDVLQLYNVRKQLRLTDANTTNSTRLDEVKNPQTYIAHRSKIRLAKKMGQKDIEPLFKLPKLPAEVMKDLAEELSTFELPAKQLDAEWLIIDPSCYPPDENGRFFFKLSGWTHDELTRFTYRLISGAKKFIMSTSERTTFSSIMKEPTCTEHKEFKMFLHASCIDFFWNDWFQTTLTM